MRRTFFGKKSLLLSSLSVALFHGTLSAQEISLAQKHDDIMSDMNVIEFPALDNDQLIEKYHRNVEKNIEANGKLINRPTHIAEGIATDISPDEWQTLFQETLDEKSAEVNSVEMAVWRTQISSPGALSLNLGFGKFFLPKGAKLYLYSEDGKESFGPLTHKDNDYHRQYWTPMIAGDSLILELNVPADVVDQVKLNLSQVNHGYLGSGIDSSIKTAEDIILKSGSCNVDTICSEGNDWRDQINAVASYSYSTGRGSFVCTGSAINNTANDKRRLFLTAQHCLGDSSTAPSVVAYWKYENTTCRAPNSASSGSEGDGRRDLVNSGSRMLASYEESDMYLLEFDDPFPREAYVYLAGWNRAEVTPQGAVGIHHPQGEEKRISFENDPLVLESNNTHIRVLDWDIGTTEGGSSGSPLFDLDKLVIGQLTGGRAACGNDEYDIYGRMSVNWTGGGTTSTRVSDWLDPTGSGVMTLAGQYVNGEPPLTPQTPTQTPTPAPAPTQSPNSSNGSGGGGGGSLGFGLLALFGMLVAYRKKK